MTTQISCALVIRQGGIVGGIIGCRDAVGGIDTVGAETQVPVAQSHLDEVGVPLVVQYEAMASTVAHKFHYPVNC